MSVPAIETHDLHVQYGKDRTEVRALDGVDLKIHVVGALESPTSGTITVGGRRSLRRDR